LFVPQRVKHYVRGVLTCVCAEAFADRRYELDGTLRSRKHPDALILDPAEAAQQAVTIVQGKVIARDDSEVPLHADTLCIHSDTPGSPQIAAKLQGLFAKRACSSARL